MTKKMEEKKKKKKKTKEEEEEEEEEEKEEEEEQKEEEEEKEEDGTVATTHENKYLGLAEIVFACIDFFELIAFTSKTAKFLRLRYLFCRSLPNFLHVSLFV